MAQRPATALEMLCGLLITLRVPCSSVGWLDGLRYSWTTLVLSDAVIPQWDKRADLGSLAAGL